MQRINKKGQALIEFVLIIPILIMILFAIIDISSILYNKNHLETVLNDTVNQVENGKSFDEINTLYKDIDISYKYQDNMIYIKLSKSIKLITPLSSTILENPYIIETERVVYYE